MYTVKAVRKDNNQWIKGYLWMGANNAYVIPYNCGVGFEANRLSAPAYEVIKETICRATSIDAYWIDKTGAHIQPIYENDIVVVNYNEESYVGKVVYDLGMYIIKIPELPEEFVTFIDRQHSNSNLIDVQIVGNTNDIITKASKTPSKAQTEGESTSEPCPFYERREMSYDVLSGHSDYQEYCTKNYEKKIIKCVHCTLCKQKQKT